MIKEKIYFQTNDGLVYKTRTEAEAHVINNVQELFDKKLSSLKSGAGSKLIYHSDLYKVISALTVNLPAIIDTYKELTKILTRYDTDIEEGTE